MKMDLRLVKENQNRLYSHACPSNFDQVYDISRMEKDLATCYETLIKLPIGICATN